MVHVGFMRSWLAGGLNVKVIDRIMHLVQAATPTQRLLIYVTGMHICHHCHHQHTTAQAQCNDMTLD